MSRYLLSPAAIRDIDGIWDCTAENWSVSRANAYVGEIKKACERLARRKARGRSIGAVRQGYFKYSVGSHFIIFRTVDEAIDMVRILHQRMDIPAHSGSDLTPH